MFRMYGEKTILSEKGCSKVDVVLQITSSHGQLLKSQGKMCLINAYCNSDHPKLIKSAFGKNVFGNQSIFTQSENLNFSVFGLSLSIYDHFTNCAILFQFLPKCSKFLAWQTPKYVYAHNVYTEQSPKPIWGLNHLSVSYKKQFNLP